MSDMKIDDLIINDKINIADGRLYIRILAQAREPKPGTGDYECDEGELLIWVDTSTLNKTYLVTNIKGKISTWESA
ncbi:MAG: hypothetical protein DRJ03_02715 [Chloroflexi bacterium]|nr:MAG: hypothetical protein DRJ03_02715 [Chloroflexota bacterium]